MRSPDRHLQYCNKTPVNKSVVVPNGAIYENTILTCSALDTRRVDLVFGIGHGDAAKEILHCILTDDKRTLADPGVHVQLAGLIDSSVDLHVRNWVGAVKSDVIEKVKLTFDANGIAIPFPQRDVHREVAR